MNYKSCIKVRHKLTALNNNSSRDVDLILMINAVGFTLSRFAPMFHTV